MPELIRHHTPEGVRYGVVVHLGRKWMKVWYVAFPRATRMRVDEQRWMRPVGTLSPKQRKRFNQSVRRVGGKRGAI